ncbi:hypothetical protein CKO_04015 [Citrobacter koseri ATCC BAA-895]|uniref:Uncharacterized protein n=1 Tax=Citrobacter koseri (strain ATCC BAA-895 / CDC 4225-83 / SGSC4696) TaxID=290338 RepID=A8ANM4_CITK8|nr:hypothetical protein CKO_04015 [Citrobacter koseri ATCC BAA-895]
MRRERKGIDGCCCVRRGGAAFLILQACVIQAEYITAKANKYKRRCAGQILLYIPLSGNIINNRIYFLA